MMKNKPWLILSIAVFLGIAVVFGAVFGTIAAVRASSAVLSYEGQTVSKGVYSYFASYCKAVYLRGLRLSGVSAADTRAFFSRDRGDGVTYGEAYLAYTEEYVRALLVSAYLFDRAIGLSSSERKTIRKSVDELVALRADGDRAQFNRLTEPYGFTYSDLLTAATMEYKAQHLFSALYGNGASYMAADAEACRAYYESTFSYVRLLFIRTESKFATDEQGNRIPSGDGTDLTIDLSASEKQERAQAIATIDNAILALENGTSGVMNDTMFTHYMQTLGEGDPTYDKTGWYFAADARFTKEFASVYESIVNVALTAEIGSYTKVPYDAGVCYVFRDTLPKDGYASKDAADFFSDFYMICASATHKQQITERMPDVKKTERFSTVDPIAIPYNTDYSVRFS